MQVDFGALFVPFLTFLVALLTRSACFSLLTGIFCGSCILCEFDLFKSLSFAFSALVESLSASNLKVIVFLVMLGGIVALIKKTGVTASYAKLVGTKLRTRREVLLLTALLSSVFSLDDYFDCLTTGSIITPISKHRKVFPGRVAHVIHSITISCCVLVPISSWAAAISSTFVDSGVKDGLALFIKIIPFNFYAIVTIVSVVAVIYLDISIFKMKKEERKFLENSESTFFEDIGDGVDRNIKKNIGDFFLELVFPLFFLILSCVFGLLYTGGITEGKNFFSSLSNCDSSTGLLLGATIAYIFLFFLHVVFLRITKLGEFFNSITEGLKEMSGAVVILVLAWTLGNLTSNYFKISVFFENIIKSNISVLCWLPFTLFFISAVLSVSTGTSWGTFAILIPVVFPILQSHGAEQVLFSSLAAILSGAAFGDNVSPISDTTIMVSTSAGCPPLVHSFTQFPYAAINAAISAVCFLLAGFVHNAFVLILISFFLLGVALFFMKKISLC